VAGRWRRIVRGVGWHNVGAEMPRVDGRAPTVRSSYACNAVEENWASVFG
jgi:hypothetical protein